MIQDLSGYVGSEDLSEAYIPFAWAEANFQGKPYALPFDTDARALFYNKGMLKDGRHRAAQLDAPTANHLRQRWPRLPNTQ